MAEKEIILKNKRIESLEAIIDQINKTGNVDSKIIEQIKQEHKKLEINLLKNDVEEE